MKHNMKISEDDMFDEVDRRERIKMKCEKCKKNTNLVIICPQDKDLNLPY